MGYVKDPRVDTYLDALPEWQRAILSRVRDLVHEADPQVEETIKRTVQPYFVLNGNVCAFLAAKDHVNVFLYDPIAPDPEGLVTSGHDNLTGRTISYRDGETINERVAGVVPGDHRQQPGRRLATDPARRRVHAALGVGAPRMPR